MAKKEKINISLDRYLWNDLSKYAHHQSISHEERFTTIRALRTAIHVFLKLENKEINQILRRDTRNIG